MAAADQAGWAGEKKLMWWQWLLGILGLVVWTVGLLAAFVLGAKARAGEAVGLNLRKGRVHYRTDEEEARLEAERLRRKLA